MEDSIYFSNDTGKRPLSDITDIEYTDGYLYLGTKDNGLWRWKLEDILTTDLKETNGKANLLLFPNPASDALNIVGLPEESIIQIFNSSGQ